MERSDCNKRLHAVGLQREQTLLVGGRSNNDGCLHGKFPIVSVSPEQLDLQREGRLLII